MPNTLEIAQLQQPDGLAKAIANKYVCWETAKEAWYVNAKETLENLYATDTRQIYNQTRDFDNCTHIPKITQIRDMLVTYYLEAMFSLPDFVDWEAYDYSSTNLETKNTLKNIIKQMLHDSSFKPTIRELVEDYVDYGNAFVTAVPVIEKLNNSVIYDGPKATRINPLDIFFDPLATSFEKSPKIIRSLTTIGELMKAAEELPEDAAMYKEAVKKAVEQRTQIYNTITAASNKDQIVDDMCRIAGLSSWTEYYSSDLVEIVTFYGDIYDIENKELHSNKRIVIMDRSKVLLEEPIKDYGFNCNIFKAGWRDRKDNLWSMSPLDNIKGMQFNIDFLENKRADIFNFISNPIFVTRGDVEMPEYPFPGCRIDIDNDSDVQMLRPDTTALQADLYIDRYMTMMEEMAGTPKEAMGFRTPGEKTAFEVSQLNTAASRLFNEKVRKFEEEMLEPLLTLMLRVFLASPNRVAKVKSVDADGVITFQDVNLDALSANGRFVATGSNTYTEKARIAQTLLQLSNSALMADPLVSNNFAPDQLAKIITYATGLDKFPDLIRENARVDAELDMRKAAEFSQQQLEETQMRGAENAQQAIV